MFEEVAGSEIGSPFQKLTIKYGEFIPMRVIVDPRVDAGVKEWTAQRAFVWLRLKWGQ